jgi:hypothetical protein
LHAALKPAGGLLQVVAFGGARLSADAWFKRLRETLMIEYLPAVAP